MSRISRRSALSSIGALAGSGLAGLARSGLVGMAGYGLAGTTACGLISPVAPAQASTPLKLDYRMTVGGIEVARTEIRFEPGDGVLDVRLVMRNTGVASWLAGETQTFMQTRLVDKGDGRLEPERFMARYKKPDRTREMELIYGAGGELVDVQVRHRGKDRESRVPEELRAGTVDPLTALVRMQAWVGAGREAGDEMRVAVFDGRKRADLRSRLVGVDGTGAGALYRLAASLEGLSGFERGDALVSLPGEEPRWLDIRAAGGERPFILAITDPAAPLPTAIELEKRRG